MLIKELHLKRNKGFTLVELIVVLVLMAILFSVAAVGILGWIDWVTFTKENGTAEDIFYAAQNQLTDLDSSGALNRRVTSEIEGNNDLILAQGTSGVTFDNGFNALKITKENDSSQAVGYSWGDVWVDKNKSNQTRTIYKLRAEHGDYSAYLAGTLTDDNDEKGARLLFELVAPYIADKSVLDGAISLEFSPEAAQVFAVCYSDKNVSFSYGDDSDYESSTNKSVNISNRWVQERRNNMVGYYGVDTMNAKIRGRDYSEFNYKLEIDNGSVLLLKLSSEDLNNKLTDEYLEFTINGSPLYENASFSPVMKFTVPVSDITNTDLVSAAKYPLVYDANDPNCPQTFEMLAGYYVEGENAGAGGSEKESFKLPIWKEADGSICIVLDAADIQAQSIIYAGANNLLEGETESDINAYREAFANTYSFYRFGLNDIRYITASVVVKSNDKKTIKGDCEAQRSDNGAIIYDIYGEEGAPVGECVTFANYDAKDYDNESNQNTADGIIENIDKSSENIYRITNGRHLYNVRYETDYKVSSQTDKSKIYKLCADIDWNDFTSGGTNYFLDSNTMSSNTIDGIELSGIVKTTKGTEIDFSDTKNCPFPGFRCLSPKDVFAQKSGFNIDDLNSIDSYSISNLEISLTGNIIYGVYGNAVKEKCLSGDKYDFSTILGLSSSGAATLSSKKDESAISNYTGYNEARAGKLPLGLFAENLGTIENIILDKHIVKGLEEIDNTVIYTNMVGGFAGNNIGTVKNLALLDRAENVTPSDNKTKMLTSGGKTHINGRTDVGGIIGRESFVMPKNSYKDRAVTLENLWNYGQVTGLENVGGIVGRAYVHYVGDDDNGGKDEDGNLRSDQINCPNVFNVSTGTSYAYDESPRANYYSDGYYISDTGISMSGQKVERAYSVTISNCTNRGKVSGDALLYSKGIDGKEVREANSIKKDAEGYYNPNNGTGDFSIKHCAFIGGIAGVAQDGFLIDGSKIGSENSNDKRIYKLYSRFFNKSSNGNSTEWIKIKDCNSCFPYSEADVESELSKNQSLNNDYYVGCLVGYSRLAAIENCTNTLFGYEITDSMRSFVFGSRYVGGLIGCSDLTRYDNTQASGGDEKTYAAINSSAVIGRLYVGGVAGAFGIGAFEQDVFSFRNPSDAIAKNPSMYGDNAAFYTVSDLKNEGIVLALKSVWHPTDYNKYFYGSKPGNDQKGNKSYNYSHDLTGFVGGITGYSRINLNDCDNIQSQETKLYMLKLLGFENPDNNTLANINADTLNSVVTTSRFGGNCVGGIVGYVDTYSYINNKTASGAATIPESQIDAVVYGYNMVGGGIAEYANDTSTSFNFYPVKANEGSTGMLVLGNDVVGGAVGRIPENPFNNSVGAGNNNEKNRSARKITDAYTVVGRYSVGGFAGRIAGNNDANKSRTSFSINVSEGNKVKVDGIAFTGGIAGSTFGWTARYPLLNGEINGVEVNSRLFAGGYIGAIILRNYSTISDLEKMFNNSQNFNVVSGDVDVSAAAFAGGVVGAYIDYNNEQGDNLIDGKKISDPFASSSDPYSFDKYLDGFVATDRKINENNDYIAIAKRILVEDLYETDGGRNNLFHYTYDGRKDPGDVTWNCSTLRLGEGSSVTAGVFAGGLLGYVPEKVILIVKNYNNMIPVSTARYITADNYDDITNGINLSYLGGVVGRIPTGMIVEHCSNSVSEGYVAPAETSYIGGLAEVNAGKIKGDETVASDGTRRYCINNTVFNNPNGGVGAFAGINGTAKNSDEKPATIAYCSNTADLSGKYVGGIAGTIDGTSKIIGCINHGELNAYNTASPTYTGAAGIVYDVYNSSTLNISECVNTGILRVNKDDSTAETGLSSDLAAGIVYSTNGLGNIINCRNYGTKLKNGITATDANAIKYCLDATNSGNHFGSIIEGGSMLANFYIGRNSAMPADPGENISEGEGFRVFQSYCDPIYSNWNHTVVPEGNYFIHGFGDEVGVNDISNMVLSISANDYNSVDIHNDASYWNIASDNKKLMFTINPVSKDGLQTAFADIDDFGIVWDNYKVTDFNRYYKYANDPTVIDEFKNTQLTYWDGNADITRSFYDIAYDEYNNQTNKRDYPLDLKNAFYSTFSENDYTGSYGQNGCFAYAVATYANLKAKTPNWNEQTGDTKAYNYIEELYANVSKYCKSTNNSAPNLKFAMDVVITSRDVAGNDHKLCASQYNVSIQQNSDSSAFSKMNMDSLQGADNLYKDPEFDPSRIISIQFAIKNGYSITDSKVGVRAFLWNYNDEQIPESGSSMPLPEQFDSDGSPIDGTANLGEAIGVIKNNNIQIQKLVVDQETASPYALLLGEHATPMNKLTYNPLDDSDTGYLNDVSQFSDECMRVVMWTDVDKAYSEFIKNNFSE